MKKIVYQRNTYGTRQWAAKTINCTTGCSHDCRYCYAKAMALRFRQVPVGKWPLERLRPRDVLRAHPKYPGRVMFPSSHDITPANLQACILVLQKLLKTGNRVLVVSKPHLDCIQALCQALRPSRKQVLFRFTIGARDNRVLSFWEPGAPAYEERMAALRHTYGQGFQTSVSVEPMLDPLGIDDLISAIVPYVTETIWIGKMNHLGRFQTPADRRLLREIVKVTAAQCDARIIGLFERYKGSAVIKWKSSILRVVKGRSLQSGSTPGLKKRSMRDESKKKMAA